MLKLSLFNLLFTFKLRCVLCRTNYSFNYPVSMLCNSIHVEWRRVLRLYWQWRRCRMFLWQQSLETVSAACRYRELLLTINPP